MLDEQSILNGVTSVFHASVLPASSESEGFLLGHVEVDSWLLRRDGGGRVVYSPQQALAGYTLNILIWSLKLPFHLCFACS